MTDLIKVLIIDDSEYKIAAVNEILAKDERISSILKAKSFQTGRKILLSENPDAVVLDMTIPTSERPDGALEGRMRSFGGREIMEEIKRYHLKTRVIVLSQFDEFGQPPSVVKLADLFVGLKRDFSDMFMGGLYYSSIDLNWRKTLVRLINKIIILSK